jgi:hypothetical protein
MKEGDDSQQQLSTSLLHDDDDDNSVTGTSKKQPLSASAADDRDEEDGQVRVAGQARGMSTPMKYALVSWQPATTILLMLDCHENYLYSFSNPSFLLAHVGMYYYVCAKIEYFWRIVHGHCKSI